MSFLSWLEQTGLAQYLAADPYAYPIVLCFHAIGMAAAVGILWVLSLRVLGFPGALPPKVFPNLARIALYGFAINAVSGVLLFIIDATRLVTTPAFLIKMASILLGGVAAWFLVRSVRTAADGAPVTFSKAARLLAAAGSSMGLVAVVSGRLIAYTIKPPF